MKHRIMLALALCALASPLSAQHAKRDSSLATVLKSVSDTIFRDKSRPAYVERARLRVLAVSDSLKKSKPDTVLKVRVDTVYVTKPDTVKPPTDTTKPNVITITIHSNGSTVEKDSTLQLYTEMRNSNGSVYSGPVTWGTKEGTRLYGSISTTGLLKGLAVGTVTVIAKADTFQATRDYPVIVTSPTPPDSTPVPPTDTTPGAPPGTIYSHPYPPLSNGAMYAELPRDSVSIAVPAPTRTITVASLQAALDTAKTGDLLKIPSNHTTTHLYLRENQPHVSWVTIQGTDSTSVITQTLGGAVSAINIEPRAHHVRFLGPLTVRTQTDATNAMIRSYNGETTLADQVHDMILDGITVDAGNFEVRRCAWFDGVRMAIVRSKFLNCASRSGDAQAILVGNGPGPYRFQSNWLEGGHQCIMSGGFDPAFKNNLPSDAYVADNTCYKRPEWHFTLVNGSKDYTGVKRQVKTTFEMKFGKRWLYERNRCINLWADAQAGFAILFKSEDQSGGNPAAQTADITFRYNHCTTVANGANFAANPGSFPAINMSRVSFYDNLFETLSSTGGEGKPVQILGPVQDLVVMNNTFRNATNDAISWDGGAGVRTSILRNIIPHGAYGVKGSGSSDGTASLNIWVFPTGLFLNNVIVGSSCSQYPATTTCTLPAPAGVGADTTKVPR